MTAPAHTCAVTGGLVVVDGWGRCSTCQRVTCVSPVEAEQFWSSLTPAQALALLKAAPRVAGPWVAAAEPEYPGAVERVGVTARRIGDVWHKENGPPLSAWGWMATVDGDDTYECGAAATIDEAKAACDAALRARGWVLA